MSADGTLPPGVEHSHPHFNPPDAATCGECGAELEDLVGGDLGCPNKDCTEHDRRIDPEEAYAPEEPDWDAMPGGADHY